jgi:hypothetical protein
VLSGLMVCWCLIDGATITGTIESRGKERTEGRADKKYTTRQNLLGLANHSGSPHPPTYSNHTNP